MRTPVRQPTPGAGTAQHGSNNWLMVQGILGDQPMEQAHAG
ncbi:MAG: hypothetical protein RMK29_20040 [Myxococcales bacterium]|nr:hypothetical protein [Myxococcales bacterium]